MMKKIMLAALCLCLANSAFAADLGDGDAENKQANKHVALNLMKADYLRSMELVTDAYSSYIAARVAVDDSEANAKYAEAIDYISKSVALDKDNADAWLLGAQIYRARGGISYAKNYFAHAQAAYEKKMIENMASPDAKIKYAIACYAGDARYLTEYSDYKVGAYIAANEALKLIAAEEKEKHLPRYDLPKLLAHIILQDQYVDDALNLLKHDYEKNSLEYKLASEMYEDMAASGKWLWSVSSKENAEKEFLLYCTAQLYD